MRLPTIILLGAIGVYAVGDAALAPMPAPEHPGFVDAILASRAAMAAIRLAIVFGGVFVVVSVIALIAQRRWLTRVGPVEVSEQAAGFAKERRRLEEKVLQAESILDSLRQQLSGVEGELFRPYPDARKDQDDRSGDT